MPSIIFHPETFAADGVNAHGDPVGTAEFQIGSRTYTTRARRGRAFGYQSEGKFDVAYDGFVGRYLTSQKPWSASVRVRDEGAATKQAFVNFGRDDRSGRFNKLNAISFEPSDEPNPYFYPA